MLNGDDALDTQASVRRANLRRALQLVFRNPGSGTGAGIARAPGLTLVFDEIDRGVGGATADAVGRRLGALGAAAQVLVVTHSGRTSDVKAAVELAKKNGAKIICITHSYHSPIAKLADYIICSPAPETPLLGRNASARILQLTLLDAFFVSVAQLNIEQANINMQKTGAIVDFFSPGALK